eukprot:6695510-Pyramimonas_sp.AAC.1
MEGWGVVTVAMVVAIVKMTVTMAIIMTIGMMTDMTSMKVTVVMIMARLMLMEAMKAIMKMMAMGTEMTMIMVIRVRVVMMTTMLRKGRTRRNGSAKMAPRAPERRTTTTSSGCCKGPVRGWGTQLTDPLPARARSSKIASRGLQKTRRAQGGSNASPQCASDRVPTTRFRMAPRCVHDGSNMLPACLKTI